MVVDANLYQDATEIADVDVIQDVEWVLAHYLVETTAVYGLFYFSSSAADAEVTHLVADVAETTAVFGLFYSSSSAVDAEVTLHAATIIADATIAAANMINFEDGSGRPFCMHKFLYIFSLLFSYIFTTILKECPWNAILQNS